MPRPGSPACQPWSAPVWYGAHGRLVNHGPTVLVTSSHGGRRNVMAAAWSMPVEFTPPRIAVVIDKSTIQYTLVGDPWANVDFRFYGGTMTAATTVDITHRIDAQATQNGVRGTLQASERTLPAYITVDLAQGTPQVSFS